MSENTIPSSDKTNLGLASLAFAIVSLAILVPLLLELGYDKFDLEILSWGAAACCLAIAFGWLETKSQWLGAILFAALFYAVVDLYFVESEVLALAVLACCLLLSLPPTYSTFRFSSVVFCLIFSATSLFSFETGFFQSIERSGDGVENSKERIDRQSLRPIVHIVLDEFGSRLSVSRSAPLTALSAFVEGDYLKRGFAVFPATRATSGSSAISLSELVGPPGRRYESENKLKSQNEGHLFQVPENHYFGKLKKLGYKIVVVQSSHLNFCGRETDQCLTYRRAEFMDTTRRYGVGVVKRLRTAGLAMHARISSRTGRWGITVYRIRRPRSRNAGRPGGGARAVNR